LIELQHEGESKGGFTKGILQCLQHDEYLTSVYSHKNIKTDFELWKKEYLSNAQNIHHPLFYKIAIHAHQYCSQHMKQRKQLSTSKYSKAIESIYWQSMNSRKKDVFMVCEHVICIPYIHQECKLSYASTIHKAQGGEADYIICVMPPSMRYSVNRNLAYTAFSRARKHLYLIGLPTFFQKCNTNAPKRITLLPHIIREQMQ
jgi:superfamily I DNA and RNA helicase